MNRKLFLKQCEVYGVLEYTVDPTLGEIECWLPYGKNWTHSDSRVLITSYGYSGDLKSVYSDTIEKMKEGVYTVDPKTQDGYEDEQSEI